jgi:hypothetical protein
MARNFQTLLKRCQTFLFSGFDVLVSIPVDVYGVAYTQVSFRPYVATCLIFNDLSVLTRVIWHLVTTPSEL